jgi:hypothetical protein
MVLPRCQAFRKGKLLGCAICFGVSQQDNALKVVGCENWVHIKMRRK